MRYPGSGHPPGAAAFFLATLLAAARNALRSNGMTSTSDAAVPTGTDGGRANPRPA